MSFILTAIAFGICLFAASLFQLRRNRAELNRQNNGGDVETYHPWDPLTGLDFNLVKHLDVPFLYRQHANLGKTFQLDTFLSEPRICTIAPENIRTVNNGSDWGVEPVRLPGMEGFCGRGFLTTDGEIWHKSRKQLKPTFAKSNLQDLDALSSDVDALIAEIPQDSTTVDLQPLLGKLFLRSSMRFLLGIDITQPSEDAPCSPEEFLKAFQTGVRLSGMRIILGSAWRLMPQAEYRAACKTAHGYLDFYIDQALHGSKRSSRSAKLSMIQQLSAQANDPEYIRAQIVQAMMASQDTISALISNACFSLARKPVYWEQIRTETAGKNMSEFTFDTLLNMKSIRNILFETLRLYPNFPIQGRVALKDTHLPVGGGFKQDEQIWISAGTQVDLHYYSLHRDKAVFGDDVEEFRPERWEKLDANKEEMKLSGYEFMPFGGGNRACMGQQKVLVEAAYVLVRLAKTFSTLESRDDRPWVGDLKLTCSSLNGCQVALTK